MKVRGSAQQVVEKYLTLAREAATAGDPVMAENYYQHAEHYFRIQNANNPPANQGAAVQGNGQALGQPPVRGHDNGNGMTSGDEAAGRADVATASAVAEAVAEPSPDDSKGPVVDVQPPRRRRPRRDADPVEEPAEQPS